MKTVDHIVSDMLQREAFQAMSKLWGPLQKLRRQLCLIPMDGKGLEKWGEENMKLIEEMEKILVPND